MGISVRIKSKLKTLLDHLEYRIWDAAEIIVLARHQHGQPPCLWLWLTDSREILRTDSQNCWHW